MPRRNLSPGSGGAIAVEEKANVDVEYSSFSSNQAVVGGALSNIGQAKIIQSSFTGNIANAAVSSRISNGH